MVFLTVFDSTYLSRGLTMIESLLKWNPDSAVTVLAIDEDTCQTLFKSKFMLNERISVISLSSIEDSRLETLRNSRPHREFCWALASYACCWGLRTYEEDVVYLDADLYFAAPVEEILKEQNRGSIAAVGHRFPEAFQHFERNGYFNVQWIYFRADAEGRACAEEWLRDCITSTAYSPELGIVGDQKYLDLWPRKFGGFVEIENPGAGVAPWNISTHICSKRHTRWYVNETHPLVFFHFQGLKVLRWGLIKPTGSLYMKSNSFPFDLYKEYCAHLARFDGQVQGGSAPESTQLRLLGRTCTRLFEFAERFRRKVRQK